MISKLLFKYGQQFRNPSLKSWFQFLKSSEKWSVEQLESYQLKKLKELVQHAYESSLFYKKKFDAIGMKPSEIFSLEDLKKLPLLTKKELIQHTKEVHSTKSFKKIRKAATSGTSGESLKFNREEEADSFNRASIFRGYSWYHVNPWERNGYFWGFNFSRTEQLKTKLLDRLQNRFRLFSYESKAVRSFSHRLTKATYLHGYSSMIYETAKLINTQAIKKPSSLKLVKGTSEKIVDAYQNEVKKAYGVKMISEYGAAETGIIAFECPSGNMHLNMEGVIVESIANEIVVTNLQMHSFPIIRYKLGDYIKLAPIEKVCACGMQHQLLTEVTGRIGAVVYGNIATYPSLYFYYIFKNLATKYALNLNYKVVQHKKGNLMVYIEQLLDEKELQLIKSELEVYFKNDVLVEIKMDQRIHSKNQKLQSFSSKIA